MLAEYAEIFKLVDSTHTVHKELMQRFGTLHQNGSGPLNGHSALLNESLDRLTDQFLRHHPVPLIVETDLKGVVMSVNDAYCTVSGYAREELVGQNISILKSSHTEPGVFTDLWNNISAGKPWTGELRNRTKDYELYAVEITIVPVLGEDGKPQKYWSVSFDITDLVKKQELLEAKTHDVLESLNYAKRIQKTILPDKAAMDEHLNDYFILYKPKDIVSGDFYWYTKNIRTVFVAMVDCTGHGVPGAFMSLIGFNLLNQIVNEQKIVKPGEILTELHRRVRLTLKQDAEDSKSRDGMDVCLVAIDIFDDSFEYAGANRPLFIWSAEKKELTEIKADKYSIGGEQMEEERTFTNHSFEVSEGDAVYLVSDGFTDQFGGPEGKKLSTKRFKQHIEDNYAEPMNVQRAMFNILWKDWKGDGEQIDDVTLIGIRF